MRYQLSDLPNEAIPPQMNDPESAARRGSTADDSQKNNTETECGGYDGRKEKASHGKEIRLVIIAGLLAVSVIALIIALTLQLAVFRRDEHENMCQSEECIKTAARLMEGMNRTADPCKDFYEFACGGWIEKHPIPQSQTSWDQLSLLREELLRNLRILLEEPDEQTDLEPVKLARALYRTCMDTGSVEALGLEPIFDVLDRVGLPRVPPVASSVPQEAPRSSEKIAGLLNLSSIAGRTQRLLGLNLLVNFYISEDIRDTTRNRMMMEQASPGFSERYLLDPERFQSELVEYKAYIKAMVELAGIGEGSVAFADELVDFSTKIAKIMATPEERRSANHLFHDVTVKELEQLTDPRGQQWNWTEYLGSVFNMTNVTIEPAIDRVIVMDLDYLQKLPRLLAASPPGTIARFVWWSVYSTVAPLTLQKFRDIGFRFSQKVFGLREKTPRWKGCTGNVNANFGMAMSYVYARKHFGQQERERILEMFRDIRTAFDETLNELDWMDGSTRTRARRKLAAMRPFVGFPDWITNPAKLNKFYEGAEVIESKLFETFLKLTDVGAKRSLNGLREKPDKDRWISTGTTVNAFYSAILNSVKTNTDFFFNIIAALPAGILHPPFYGNGLESINYGAMGAIMGHELTHGFDDQGRRYDEDGNLRQWWSDETLQHYHKKVECIIRQYHSYYLPELGSNFTVNGINTQGENIADNGGLREAFRAYKRRKALTQNPSKTLPGLGDYSQDQLFFLGFAQVWCGSYTQGALKSKLIEGVHAPNRFRVIGTLSNNMEFAQAWKCPTDSPMNPRDKCVLW